MNNMRDNFSNGSDQYAKFRPVYPDDLFTWIYSLIDRKVNAWDCGTGTGQVAAALSNKFNYVYATDISANQLKASIPKSNIIYLQERAEKTSFQNDFFDLITVAQAIHWFKFDEFYKEVYRTLKPEGIFAVIGYYIPSIDPQIDVLLWTFYNSTLKDFWDPERKYVDEHYLTIPFPFDEIQTPAFTMNFEWDADRFISFIKTWSAVQHFISTNQLDPVGAFEYEIKNIWQPGEIKKIVFPVLLRVGRKK